MVPIPTRILERLNIKCPSCDNLGTFDYKTGFVASDDDGTWEYSLWTCPNPTCNAAVFVLADDIENVLDSYPKATPKINPAIPKRVASDLVEAYMAFNANAFRASAAMGRRALQNSVLEKGAQQNRLQDQIDELEKKGVITKQIRDWAHEIRLTGNYGAHPNKDGLKNVTKDEAKELLDFLENYMNYVYVMPAKVSDSRKARERRKGARSSPTGNS